MMNRLTEWRGEHAAVVNHHENYIDRLAAYEDTGLTPEEVVKLQGEMFTAYDPDYQPYLVEATGSAAKHIVELRIAEDEGRLVVLPCKVGDTVYTIHKGTYGHHWQDFVNEMCVTEISHKCGRNGKDLGVGVVLYSTETHSTNRYKISSIGKTVFLTRKEAEAALKGGTGNA